MVVARISGRGIWRVSSPANSFPSFVAAAPEPVFWTEFLLTLVSGFFLAVRLEDADCHSAICSGVALKQLVRTWPF